MIEHITGCTCLLNNPKHTGPCLIGARCIRKFPQDVQRLNELKPPAALQDLPPIVLQYLDKATSSPLDVFRIVEQSFDICDGCGMVRSREWRGNACPVCSEKP